MRTTLAIVAHQGGWDEALLVLGPIVVIGVALAIVKRRVDRMGPPPDGTDRPTP